MAYFYHKSIETYTGVFGYLFSNLKIISNNKSIIVPVEFLSKDKSKTRSEYDLDDTKVKSKLPRLSFNLINIEKDLSRKTNSKLKNVDKLHTNSNTTSFQYNRVPYNFLYELKIKTKNISEMSQLVEQLLTMFDESLKIIIKDNKDLNSETDIFIRLLSNDLDTQSLGSYEESRIVESTLNFVLEGYLYKETSTSKTIQTIKIDLDIFDPSQFLINADPSFDNGNGSVDVTDSTDNNTNLSNARIYTTDKIIIYDNRAILPLPAIGDMVYNKALIFNSESSNTISFEVSVDTDGEYVLFDPLDNMNGKYCIVSYLTTL